MDLGCGAEAKIKLFQNMVMLHIKLKGQTIYFSESSHVAYQIKADDAGSNMVANILPTETSLTQGVGSKGQTISFTESSHVAYQIKGN